MRNLAKITRANQNLVFYALMLLCIGAFLVSCSDDDEDDNSPPPASAGPNFGVATSPTGCNFQLEFPDGSTTTVTGSGMGSGWASGNLLGGNYFKQARIFTDLGSMDFRLSIPGDTPFLDVAEQTHGLRTVFLLLEDTPGLEVPYPELFFQSNDTLEGNAAGEVIIYRDVSSPITGDFSIFGTVRAEFTAASTSFTMEGSFWSRNYEW